MMLQRIWAFQSVLSRYTCFHIAECIPSTAHVSPNQCLLPLCQVRVRYEWLTCMLDHSTSDHSGRPSPWGHL